MAVNDLCTLADVRQWLGIEDDDASLDPLISATITRVSAVLMAWLSVPSFLLRTYNEFYDGTGQRTLMLRQYPVVSIAALSVGGIVIPPNPSAPYGSGYMVTQWDGISPGSYQRLSLTGYVFSRGHQNISVSYKAGYAVQAEAQTIPNNGQLLPLSPYGLMVADNGVTFADGVPLTAIVSGTPQAGQYLPPSPLTRTGPLGYTFAAADANKAVLLSYSYIPFTVQECCKEVVGERIRYRDRIGQKSKSLGGQEVMSYNITDLPDYVKLALQNYKRVVPL